MFEEMNPTPYCINELARLCNKVEAERKRSPIFGKERGLNMGRRGRTSIVREVKESIEAIDQIGVSKRMARKEGTSGIHSKKQKENTMSDCQNFVKWARSTHEVKSISELHQGHYQGYLAYLNEKGVSEGHRMNVETSLRLLEKGYIKRADRFEGVSNTYKGFCPEKRLETRTRGLNVQNRAYTPKEMQLIREHISSEVVKAIDLMQHLGLRVREAAYVRREHFQRHPETGRWQLKIENRQGAGITKGGRYREIQIPVSFQPRVEQLLQGKEPQERLVKVASSTIRDGIHRACQKVEIPQNGRGAHGFRHAYARQRMNQLMTREQKDMMQRILSNCRDGKKANYGIFSEKDVAIYVTTKEVMDHIHGELGHGKNRWELALRYMGD